MMEQRPMMMTTFAVIALGCVMSLGCAAVREIGDRMSLSGALAGGSSVVDGVSLIRESIHEDLDVAKFYAGVVMVNGVAAAFGAVPIAEHNAACAFALTDYTKFPWIGDVLIWDDSPIFSILPGWITGISIYPVIHVKRGATPSIPHEVWHMKDQRPYDDTLPPDHPNQGMGERFWTQYLTEMLTGRLHNDRNPDGTINYQSSRVNYFEMRADSFDTGFRFNGHATVCDIARTP